MLLIDFYLTLQCFKWSIEKVATVLNLFFYGTELKYISAIAVEEHKIHACGVSSFCDILRKKVNFAGQFVVATCHSNPTPPPNNPRPDPVRFDGAPHHHRLLRFASLPSSSPKRDWVEILASGDESPAPPPLADSPAREQRSNLTI